MVLALPVLDGRVAPRLSLASDFLVIRESEGAIEDKKVVHIAGMTPFEKAGPLKNEGVEVLICSGIERVFFDYLETVKIRVVPEVAGSLDEVIESYLKGTLSTGPVPETGVRVRDESDKGL